MNEKSSALYKYNQVKSFAKLAHVPFTASLADFMAIQHKNCSHCGGRGNPLRKIPGVLWCKVALKTPELGFVKDNMRPICDACYWADDWQ